MAGTLERTEGWAAPLRSPKWHYFRKGRSLCGKWGLFPRSFEADAASPDNCAECWRRRRKEIGLASPSAEKEKP